MEMPTRNSVTVESPYGLRCFALRLGDVTESPDPVLIVPTHANLQLKPTGMVLDAAVRRYGARFDDLQPLLIANGAMGTYRVTKRGTFPGKEILVVRIPGRLSIGQQAGDHLDVLDRAMWSLFGSLAALELQTGGMTSMALPLLAGTRGYATSDLLRLILRHSLGWLRGSRDMRAVNFYLFDKQVIDEWATVMDEVLGRRSVDAAQNALAEALRAELLALIGSSGAANLPDAWRSKLDELGSCLASPRIPLERVAVVGRQFAELSAGELNAKGGGTNPGPNLSAVISNLRKTQTVAPWIVAHLDCLRHFGNAAAHAISPAQYQPPGLRQEDLVALLAAIHRIVNFRMQLMNTNDVHAIATL